MTQLKKNCRVSPRRKPSEGSAESAPLSPVHGKRPTAFSLLRITVPLEKPYPELGMHTHLHSTDEAEEPSKHTQ